MLSHGRSLSVVAILLLCVSASAPGQTTDGTISGTVLDSAGAAAVGAQIHAVNTTTGLEREAVASENGTYNLPLLPPGTYNVTATHAGFAPEEQKGLQLLVSQNATLDFTLQVSSTSETVVVNAEAELLDTSSATLSSVVQHQDIVGLPLNGRSFTQLTLLAPGAVPQQANQQGGFTVQEGGGSISPAVNGQRPQQNNFTMDGVLNNAVYTNTWAIAPPPDAIQEFAVQSHITDSQFAISSGANININSVSGTKEFHGSAWEFLRNNVLDARNFFDPGDTTPYRQNEYGINFGGPVLLPRLNTRENTWFNGYWEGFRAVQSNSQFASVPTQAMRGGDFSGVLGPQIGTDDLGRPIFQNEIYDPLTSRPDPKNPSLTIRDPFPGNIIPANRLNPVTQAILSKYYPLPNLAVGQGVLPNYYFPGGNRTESDRTGIRLDHRFGDNDILFGRYNRSDANLLRPEGLPTYQQTLRNYSQQVAAVYTHTFGPSSILTLTYGFTNTDFGQFDQASGSDFLSSTGFGVFSPARNGIPLGPQLNIGQGYTGISQFAIPLGPQYNNEGHVDYSLVRGSHTIGAGAMIYHIHSFDDGWGAGPNFAPNATSLSGAADSTGYSPASFFLGLPDQLSGFLGDTAANESTYWYAGYVQDKWQVSKKLTITAGLRYDYVAPVSYNGKIISGLDLSTGKFLVTAPVPPLYPQRVGSPNYFQAHYLGFEPRFGVAYRVTDKTVFRAAFAKFDDHNNNLVQQGQDTRIAWPSGSGISVASLNHGLPTVSLSNLPASASFFSGLQPYIAFDADPRAYVPYSLEYNAGLEQQLPASFTIDLDYVGSVSRHQFLQATANTGLYPAATPLASRQPYPQYGGPFPYDENVGNANYNALQAKLQKAFSYGLTLTTSYTWSKSLDIQSDAQSGSISNIYNLRADYGPSDFDRTHLFVVSGVYQLPFGTGRKYLSGTNKFTQTVLGGWNLSWIGTSNSGQPFSVGAYDVANVGGGAQRAEAIGNPNSGFHQSRLEWFNTAAFALPAPYTFGNSGRNILRGPAYRNLDLAVLKDFGLFENAKLQFRSEFFNLTNHTNFGLPNSGVANGSAFGQIFSAGTPREIQFALKLQF